MNSAIHPNIRSLLLDLESRWGVRPHLVLACAGGSDEHLQVFHPADLVAYPPSGPMPCYVVGLDGQYQQHPDGLWR